MASSQGLGDGHLAVNGATTSTGATYPRTTSDEMFLHSLMNSSMVPGTPAMEAATLGFMDLPPSSNSHEHHQPQQRGNSEELFHSWIANNNSNSVETPNQHVQNFVTYSFPPPQARTRQNSRRMSSELHAILQAQQGVQAPAWGARTENGEQAAYFQSNSYLAEALMSSVTNNGDHKPQRHPPVSDKVGHGTIEYSPLGPLDNIRQWFTSNSPMTRSRSSELRRKYAQLEGLPFPPPPDALQKLALNGTLEGLVSPSLGSFGRGLQGTNGVPQNVSDSKPVCSQVPLAPPVSCAGGSLHQQQQQQQHIQLQMQGPPHMEQQGSHSVVSDVVGLLKGSLERKKLQTKQQQVQQPQQEARNMQSALQFSEGMGRQDESHIRSPPDHMQQQTSLPHTQLQPQNSIPRAHSPSESSGGAPSHSAGRATSDGPSNSGMSVHPHALKRGNGVAVDQPSPKQQSYSGIDRLQSNGDLHENSSSKTDLLKKSDHLARTGSITSSPRPDFLLNDLDGATKKRRVERQRKMAEAKGRGNTPSLPPDLQAAIKRCEALEKEVRSLKLNLSFMNRKDSEQTKRIEELEQQNDELKEEKERLLEELDRVSGIMND